MPHVYECPMRRADLHPGGNVSNVMYIEYLEQARLDFLRHCNPSLLPAASDGLAVVRTAIDYLKPLRLGHAPLFVSICVAQVRAATFTLGYDLFSRSEGRDGVPVVHARAITVLTPFKFGDNRPRRLSTDERERLLMRLDDAPIEDPGHLPSTPWGDRGVENRTVQVRFTDVGLFGHVNNVKYVDYVQDAQTEYMIGVFLEAGIDQTTDLVVAHTELEYYGRMYLRSAPYDVYTRVGALGTTSVTFEVEIRDSEHVLARGRVVSVNMEPGAAGHPVPIAAHHREIYERRLREAATT